MEKIFIKARAKINLTLNVVNKRKDGYHNLESIFQKINLYDELFIEKLQDNKFELITNAKEIQNEENIIYKAYIKLKDEYRNISGIKVKLNKNIPIEAGLAGGSTDCASFLIAMNKLFDLNMSNDKMERIASKLGADVVPCFYNKAIKAQGIGDIITKIDTNFKYYILIIKPNTSNSTKGMYKKIDEGEFKQKYNTEEVKKALENNNIYQITENLYNVFEEVVDEKSQLLKIKDDLLKSGALRSSNDRFGKLCIWDF